MKTKYKFIHFIKVADKQKTSVWSCCTNSGYVELGLIKWFQGWRQYCYYPTAQAVYSAGCLEDINHFIGQVSQAKK